MERKRIRLSGKYRLITRSDFDGLVCGMLFEEAGLVDRILFAHPKDMQDGTIEVNDRDIIAGLPYAANSAATFTTSASEIFPADAHPENLVCDSRHASVARLVYSWLGGRLAFPRIDTGIIAAVDKAQTAHYTIDEIIKAQDWVLLGFLVDARTGLGRFKEFRLSNYQLMLELIPFCRNHRIAEILQHPDIQERIQVYHEHQEKCCDQLTRCIRIDGNVGILDLRNEDTIWAGNRFLIYAVFPQIQISIHIIWGLRRRNTVFAVGRSIVNPASTVDIGAVMEKYSGGGRPSAGTCQVIHEDSERVLQEITKALQ